MTFSVALLAWPFLAAFLLAVMPRAGRRAGGLTFAVAGAILTPPAVFLAAGVDAVAAWASCLVALGPLALLLERSGEAPAPFFLAAGCVLAAVNARAPLAVTAAVGAGTALLGWTVWRGSGSAVIAWDGARLRLAGVALAMLGAALLPGGAPAGAALLAVGLCVTAGLGSAPSGGSAGAVLEAGLGFASLLLLLRLDSLPAARLVALLAGFGGLAVRGGASLPALGAIAAATGEGVALLLLLAASLGAALLARFGRGYASMLVLAASPGPVFIALALIASRLGPAPAVLLAALLLPGLAHSGLARFGRAS